MTTTLSRWLPLVGVLILGLMLGALLFGGSSSDHAGHDHGDEVEVWTCSMHPSVRQPDPGQCPICGMDLIPASSGDALDAEPHQVVWTERAKTLARVRTSPVTRQAATADIRLLGRIEVDETRARTVTAWTHGRIDRLHVNETGQQVRAGQPIATLYSPEIYAAHQDLLAALHQARTLAPRGDASAEAAQAALDAMRDRLRLLGIPDDELRRMESASSPSTESVIRTPFAGTVVQMLVREGEYIETGSELYQVADLSQVWVQLDAYESDLPRLRVGQPVQVTAEALPGEVFEGTLSFVDPLLDPKLRTARARVQLDNQDGRLKPGMYVSATVFADGPDTPLVIPDTAPLFTGRRSVVYVEVSSGERTIYEPRTVRLGARLGDVYPVIAGLNAGERVVTHGAFAIDADLQIRGGPSMMSQPDDTVPGTWDALIQLTPAERDALAPVLRAYLDVQAALADDDLAAATEAAASLTRAAEAVSLDGPAAASWAPIGADLRSHGRHVATASDLSVARQGFHGLSLATERMLTTFGNPLDTPVRQVFCPMAFDNTGATWIQEGTTVDNSYFGASMLTCGEVREQVDPDGYLHPVMTPTEAAPAGHQH